MELTTPDILLACICIALTVWNIVLTFVLSRILSLNMSIDQDVIATSKEVMEQRRRLDKQEENMERLLHSQKPVDAIGTFSIPTNDRYRPFKQRHAP